MTNALTKRQRSTLAAVVDRLVPEDAIGPGALAAGVVEFIDSTLAGPLADLSDVYAEGLMSIDELARSVGGASFAQLAPTDRDAILIAIERTGTAEQRVFFELVRLHTVHGMFSDPVYGGNRGFAGWDLLGFPGPKAVFSEHDQQLNTTVVPVPRR